VDLALNRGQNDFERGLLSPTGFNGTYYYARARPAL
jgi:hypothetical protein